MKRIAWWELIPLLMLTFWLGARSLDADSIWYDEYFSIYDAGGVEGGAQTLPEIWTRLAERNPWHAPGFFMLLNGWGRLVSFDPPALRALALLIGVLAVAMTYRLGRDLVSARVGIYAAAVLGTSAFFVHYLHELRMYTLVVLLTACVLWLYLRIMSPSPRKKHGFFLWLGLLVSAASLPYTHFFAMLPLAAIGVYHLTLLASHLMHKDKDQSTRDFPSALAPFSHISGEQGSQSPSPRLRGRGVWGEGDFLARWWRVTAVFALAGALFLPWLHVLLTGVQKVAEDSDLHAKALTSPQTIERMLWLFGSGSLLLPLGILFALLPVVPKRGVKQIWFFPLCILALILGVNAVLSVMHEGRVRYLLMLWCLLALVVGVGIAKIETLVGSYVRTWHAAPLRRIGAFCALALVAAWMGVGVWSSTHDDFSASLDGHAYLFPIHRLARALPERVYPGDLLVVFIPRDGTSVDSYPRLRRFYFRGLGIDSVFAKPSSTPTDIESELQTVRDAVGSRQRFWLATMPDHDSDSLMALENRLDQDYQQCTVAVSQRDLYLTLYAQSAVCCAESASPPLARFSLPGSAGDISLLASEPLAVQGRESLHVSLMWGLSDDVPLETYSIGLKVLNSDGQVVAQADYGLLPDVFTCQSTDIPLDGVASGNYTLVAMVYDWRTGARLAIGDSDHTVIGTFEIP